MFVRWVIVGPRKQERIEYEYRWGETVAPPGAAADRPRDWRFPGVRRSLPRETAAELGVQQGELGALVAALVHRCPARCPRTPSVNRGRKGCSTRWRAGVPGPRVGRRGKPESSGAHALAAGGRKA